MSRSRIFCLVALSSVSASQGMGAAAFLHGDVNASSGLSITDAVVLLNQLFLPDAPPGKCEDAADSNDDGLIDLSDAVTILNFLFLGGPPPPEPYPVCGSDPTQDEITCDEGIECEETNGFYFVIDRSSVAGKQRLSVAKREVGEAIQQLSENVVFALVSYSQGVSRFPPAGTLRATPDNIDNALFWVEDLTVGRGSCIREGLLEAVRISQSEETQRDVIMYFGVGSPKCSGNNLDLYRHQVLEETTGLNDSRAKIDCFGIGSLDGMDEQFLRALAERNSGVFTRIVN